MTNMWMVAVVLLAMQANHGVTGLALKTDASRTEIGEGTDPEEHEAIRLRQLRVRDPAGCHKDAMYMADVTDQENRDDVWREKHGQMYPKKSATSALERIVPRWYNVHEGHSETPMRRDETDEKFCPSPEEVKKMHFFAEKGFLKYHIEGQNREEPFIQEEPGPVSGRQWFSEERAHMEGILDEVLKNIPNDGRPLVWTSRVSSFGKDSEADVGMKRYTNNFLCSTQRVGLLNRTLVLFESQDRADEVKRIFPEVNTVSDNKFLKNLQESVKGSLFEITGYRLLMHYLLVARGYPVLHVDSDTYLSADPTKYIEQTTPKDFDIAIMQDLCFLEMNGGFQYFKPTKASMKMLEYSIGLMKPTHTFDDGVLYKLDTGNDQWAINCGLHQAMHRNDLRVRALPKHLFRFGIISFEREIAAGLRRTPSGNGIPKNREEEDAEFPIVIHTTETHWADTPERMLQLGIWELDDLDKEKPTQCRPSGDISQTHWPTGFYPTKSHYHLRAKIR